MAEGYCVKERKKVEIKDPQQVTMKNGRPAIQGTCPDCGTKIFKIGKLEELVQLFLRPAVGGPPTRARRPAGAGATRSLISSRGELPARGALRPVAGRPQPG